MQNALEISIENVSRFSCEKCGANVVFDVRIGKLSCAFCGQAQEIVADGAVEERAFEESLQKGMQNLLPLARDAMQVGCTGCGAIVNFTPPETVSKCNFCGAKIVAQPKSADPLVAPEGILPFSVTDEQANENYKKWLSSRWFTPFRLKKMAQSDQMTGVYIPYWTYDAVTQSTYFGKRGTTVSDGFETYRGSNGNTQVRAKFKTVWSLASGVITRQFDDVCVPATKSLPAHYLDRLQPWDLSELKPYEPAYLSGHQAQTYQIDLDEGFEFFKQYVYNPIKQDALKEIGDKPIVTSIHTKYRNATFKHLLLPVYAGAYQFKGKTFQIVINGRTGEVQGDRPHSWLKIVSFVVGVFALFFAFFWLLGKYLETAHI
jgi:ribosomal protein S27E